MEIWACWIVLTEVVVELVKWVKVLALAVKPDDLRSVFRIFIVEGENHSQKLPFGFYICAHVHKDVK